MTPLCLSDYHMSSQAGHSSCADQYRIYISAHPKLPICSCGSLCVASLPRESEAPGLPASPTCTLVLADAASA